MADQIRMSDFIDTTSILRAVSNSTSTQLSQAMSRWASAIEKGVIKARQSELKQINAEVAQSARTAVLDAFEQSGIGLRPSYRYDDPGKLKRYSNGAIARALNSKALVQSSATGIQFVNMHELDAQAKQWYRLNFGAAPAPRTTSPEGKMRFFGRDIGGLSLSQYGLSSPFRVPQQGRGAWSSTFAAKSVGAKLEPAGRGSRGDAFYKMTRGMKWAGNPRAIGMMSKTGIEGKHFLEAGVRIINVEYPHRITELIKSWEELGRRAF